MTRCVAHVLSKQHLSPSDTNINKHTTPEAWLVMQQLTRLMSTVQADKKNSDGTGSSLGSVERIHGQVWLNEQHQMSRCASFFPQKSADRELGGRVEMCTVCVISPACIVLHVAPILA